MYGSLIGCPVFLWHSHKLSVKCGPEHSWNLVGFNPSCMADCHVHKKSALVCSPREINPVQALISDFCTVNVNTVLSVPRSCKYFFPPGVLTKLHVFYTLFPPWLLCVGYNFFFLDMISVIIIGEGYKLYSSSECCSQTPSVCVLPILPIMRETRCYMCNTAGRIRCG
jgi:hypothetical protein